MKPWSEQLDSVIGQFFSYGLEFPAPLEFGKVTRIKADGDKGRKKSGWYVCHEFRTSDGSVALVGSFGNWKINGGQGVVIEVDWTGFSDVDREQIKKQAEQQKQLAAKETLKKQAETKKRALKIWDGLSRSDGFSKYLECKKVPAYGVKFSRGSVVVPIYDIEGEICNLQFIGADGAKRFLTGGKKKGCFHKFGWVRGADVVVFAEGYATAASIYLATGFPVVVAFDCGNILPVAKNIRKKYSKLKIIIAADNDFETKGNPGLTKAREAALVVGGTVVVPSFKVAT